MGRGTWGRIALFAAIAAVAACSTCAPLQRVPIDSAPRDSSVFVDGEALGSPPLAVDLRADRDHSVFIRREGYQPVLVILTSEKQERGHRLDPGEVRVQLTPLERGRDLEVEVERRPDRVPVDPNWGGSP